MREPIQVLGDGTGFKLRAAAVIVRDGRVPMHRAFSRDLWWLPGGLRDLPRSTRFLVHLDG